MAIHVVFPEEFVAVKIANQITRCTTQTQSMEEKYIAKEKLLFRNTRSINIRNWVVEHSHVCRFLGLVLL